MEFSQDWKELCVLFDRHGVEYAVVGGIALALHGQARYTKDLDIYVKPDPANAERIVAALEAFGFGGAGFRPVDFATPGPFFILGREPTRVDLLTEIPAVTWEQVEQGRVRVDMAGVSVWVIGRNEFIKNKRAAGRPQDLADAEAVDEDAIRKRKRKNPPTEDP